MFSTKVVFSMKIYAQNIQQEKWRDRYAQDMFNIQHDIQNEGHSTIQHSKRFIKKIVQSIFSMKKHSKRTECDTS